ncbi:hypothetical protein GCM10025772_00580 [Ferrimonas gelatinilytica]|uniref:Uncharacterized protein n=1 Tax=Ferrimonas gelatinilytica TaxID=1255257 RepID=A0ABP9RTM2_9GAMM
MLPLRPNNLEGFSISAFEQIRRPSIRGITQKIMRSVNTKAKVIGCSGLKDNYYAFEMVYRRRRQYAKQPKQ